MNNSQISCSARKYWQCHIRDWLDFQRIHARLHSGLEFEYGDIDYAFGQVEGLTRLWGGRVAKNLNLTKIDVYWLYNFGIGLKMTLSTKVFNDAIYKESLPFLRSYHRKGNSIVVSTNELAGRIKNDFPYYNLEASAINDITDAAQLQEIVDTHLYDIVCLPMCVNDDLAFLESIKNKDQIRLFLNVECSYTCPQKLCYGSTSKINSNANPNTTILTGDQQMQCSHHDFNLPRKFYNDKINWGEYYFDKSKFDEMGFNNYKLVPPMEAQQRTYIMYKNGYTP